MNLRMARPVARLKAGRTDWYRVDNAVGDTTGVYIYDEIGYLAVTASDFVRDLNNVRTQAIDLHLNSPGGDVFDAVTIYNALMNHKAKVTTYVDGLAASAASFIAMAGERRVVARNAQVMIHDAHSMAVGNSGDMAAMVDLLDRCSDNIADIYAQRAGGTVGSWRKAMRAETWYTASEAVKAGLGTEIGQPADESVDAGWDLSIYAYASRETAPEPAIEPPAPAWELDVEAFARAMKEATQ